jgi:hypothetical protein
MEVAMKKTLIIVLLLSGALLGTGCHNWIYDPDIVPPAAPTGVRTATGDGFIEILWAENREPDLVGYRVYVSSSYEGRYEFIGTAYENYFLDEAARNGSPYYYAVTAFDDAGNESELSRDVAYDIPRPEGYDLLLNDYRTMPNTAGYDFSTYAVVPYTDQYVDMWFENYSGTFYMNVGTDTDIQDMGPTVSILEIGLAPAGGWSPTHDVVLKVGHTYVVWTWDDHYAKFRVRSLSSSRVVFDWAYQLVPSTPLLKRPVASQRPTPALARIR